MEKTLKQIADDLKIDKQRIYRFVKKNHISEAHQKNGVNQYGEAAQNIIRKRFVEDKAENTTSEKSLESTSFDVILKQSEMLKNELEIKNKQIEAQQRTITELTAALQNTTESLKAAQALRAGTIRQQLTDGSTEPAEPEQSSKRKGFWGIFKKKIDF